MNDKLPQESAQAHHAFICYRDLRVDRSIPKAAARCSKSHSLLKRWSARHHWQARVRAWDAEQNRLRDEAAKQALVEVTTEAVRQYELSAQRTLREMSAVAFTRLDQVAEWNDDDVILKDSKNVPTEALAAVKKISIRKDKSGNVVQKSIEMHDKLEAGAYLGKNQRLWGEKDTESEVAQRNNFLVFIQMAKSGQLNDLVKRITGEDMPDPEEVVELPSAGEPFQSRD